MSGGGGEIERLEHCEEWCEQPTGGPHDDTCPDAPMPGAYTKADFVFHAEAAAHAAIEAYRICRDDEAMSHEDALELALAENEESAVCFTGIGSCGRGWCQHS